MSPSHLASLSFSPYPGHHPPAAVQLVTLPEHDCPYLPGRLATTRAFYAATMTPQVYHDFMDAGFRRSGKVIYQPICRGCRACLPIRVPTATFQPDKSQRRCWRKNQDLILTIAGPEPTDEKFDLYRRYLVGWHGKADADDRDSFESFLYDSPVETLEFSYRDPSGKLLAIGICDLSPRSLSSVYFYHDPAEAHRGLGTFGALIEIAEAQSRDIPCYYLGFWVSGCAAMEYKANFRPCEVLEPDGVWRAVR